MGAAAQETGVDEVTDDDFRRACNVFGFAPSRALREMLDAATAQAVIAEREAVIKATIDQGFVGQAYADDFAAAIRARGQA